MSAILSPVPSMPINPAKFDPTPAAETPAKLHLLNPATGDVLVDDDGNDCGFLCLGTDSRAYKAVESKHTNNMLAAVSATGGMRAITEESVKGELIEKMAACVVGWWNIGDDSGALDYSPEAVLRLLRQQPWMLDQVKRFVENRRNFLPPAAR